MYTVVKTLEDVLMENKQKGEKILPLILGCFPSDITRRFYRLILKKVSMQDTCLKAIAFKEYCYEVACGRIPISIPFEKYFSDGDIPDQYGLSMLMCLMEQLSIENYDVAYLYLYYVIDNLIGPL